MRGSIRAFGIRRRRRLGPVGKLLKNPAGLAGVVILLLLAAAGVAAYWVMPYDFDEQNLFRSLEGPSGDHWLGTDELGRDIFSRILWGIRYTVLIPVAGVFVGAVLGAVLGIVGGYFGGRAETVTMGIVEAVMTFPQMVVALVVVSVLGVGIGGLVAAIAFATMAGPARIARGAVLSVRELEYIQASKTMGSADGWIVLRHVLPNIFSPVIVQVTLELSQGVLLSTALGFLGLGVQPPLPEWGAMLSQARAYLTLAPHMMLFPGMFIALLILGLNLAGDAVRDLLDPRMRRFLT